MTNSTFPRFRQAIRVVVVSLVLMATAASAQVTWPTLPPGFKAKTNAVSIWPLDPLPDWATKALDADDPALVDNSLRTLSDETKRENLRQRIFYESLRKPATKVAEWCLVDGASLGLHTVLTERRSLFMRPLSVTISWTNVAMARLLIAAGEGGLSSGNPGNMTVADDFVLKLLLPYFPGLKGFAAAKPLLLGRWQPPTNSFTTAQLEMAAVFTQAGFDPFSTNHPPFLGAVRSAIEVGLWDLADVLLTNQPLPALRSERGTISLNLALLHGRTNAGRFLRSVRVPIDRFTEFLYINGEITNTFFSSAEWGSNIGMFEMKVAAKTVPLGSFRNTRGESLMWPALRGGYLEFYAANGVSPSLRDNKGNTVLHAAASRLSSPAYSGSSHSVATLLKLGADPAATNLAGATPMHLLREFGPDDVAKLKRLLEAKAPLETLDLEGRTPLLAALDNGCTNFAMMLLDAGADPKPRARWGRTALHLLADAPRDYFQRPFFSAPLPRHGLLENSPHIRRSRVRMENLGPVAALVARLAGSGVDTDRQDDFGDTALHLAARNGNPLMENALLQSGASVAVRNTSGLSALFELCSSNDRSLDGRPLVPGTSNTVWEAVGRRDAATLDAFLKADPAVLFARDRHSSSLLREIFKSAMPRNLANVVLVREKHKEDKARPMLEVAAQHLKRIPRWHQTEPLLCAVLLDDLPMLEESFPSDPLKTGDVFLAMNAAVRLGRINVIALLAGKGIRVPPPPRD